MSNKLVAMQRLTNLLEGLTDYTYKDAYGVSNTVEYDLAGRVYRGRRSMPVEEIKNCIAIMEVPRPQLGSGVGYNQDVRSTDWTVNLQGWPVEDREHPSDPAYVMAAAVLKRLGRITAVVKDTGDPLYPEHYLLGGAVTKLIVADSVVMPPTTDLSAVTFWYMPLVISIVQDPR